MASHAFYVVFSSPAILIAIGLHILNKWYRQKYPKKKTKDEQIKGLKGCIETLQVENKDYKATVSEMAEIIALKRLEDAKVERTNTINGE